MAQHSLPKFRAFLSYSRKDEAAAVRLHRRLEAYEIPKALRKDGERRLGRIFRDRDELPAAGELGAELQKKLDQSDRLIVCCSPAAAASRWVNAEVERVLSTRGSGAIVAVIVEGTPEDAFPPALRGFNPLAADFRKQGDGEEIGFLKVVAGLLQVDLGELRDRQAAAERARMRLRSALIGLFALLAVIAGAAAYFAVQQRNRAEAMALEAVDIGAGVVDKASDLSRTYGVPTEAVEGLLRFASDRYERLFDAGVANDELARRRALLLLSFGESAARGGDVGAQRKYAEAAIAQFTDFLRRGMAPPAGYSRALMLAGEAAMSEGDETAAFRHLEGAVQIARATFNDTGPSVADRTFLGKALSELGSAHLLRLDAMRALPLLRESAALLEENQKAAPADDVANTNLIAALDLLGGAQALVGERAAATETLDRAVALGRVWSSAHPNSLPARSSIATSLLKLGQIRSEAGDAAGAAVAFTEAIDITRELRRLDPRNAEFERDLGLQLSLSAAVAQALGQSQKAALLREEGLEVARSAAARDPRNAQAQDGLARTLAVEYFALSGKDSRGARAAANELAAVRRGLVTLVGATSSAQRDLALALELLGDASAADRDLQGTLAAYNEAEPLRRALAAAARADVDAQAAHGNVLHVLGLSRKIAQDLEGARAALLEAADLRIKVSASRADDLNLAFATVETLQQLALVEAYFDAAATKQRLQQTLTILQRLVATAPRDRKFRLSLTQTEDLLKEIR